MNLSVPLLNAVQRQFSIATMTATALAKARIFRLNSKLVYIIGISLPLKLSWTKLMEHQDHHSHFNNAKMARFCSFAPSSLLLGGWGIIVPFYSVQVVAS